MVHISFASKYRNDNKSTPLVVGMATRNQLKLDCGSELRGRGRPSLQKFWERESKCDIVDGS